jgi:uncharacterized protein with NRDE domain
MCTVTFIPVAGKIFLTSNRDEKTVRQRALPPRFYVHNNIQLIYPKDGEAGGTWIALNENGHAGVLLNGAFTKHRPSPPYRKSRGIVFVDIIKTNAPLNQFLYAQLSGIEPFTIIILEQNNLFECRWTGDKKFYRQLNQDEPHIWSSATLYDNPTVKKRERWFMQWLAKESAPGFENILQFHRFAGDGDKHTDLLMNRGGTMHTVSITSIETDFKIGKMRYLDLSNDQMFSLVTELFDPVIIQNANNV